MCTLPRVVPLFCVLHDLGCEWAMFTARWGRFNNSPVSLRGASASCCLPKGQQLLVLQRTHACTCADHCVSHGRTWHWVGGGEIDVEGERKSEMKTGFYSAPRPTHQADQRFVEQRSSLCHAFPFSRASNVITNTFRLCSSLLKSSVALILKRGGFYLFFSLLNQ